MAFLGIDLGTSSVKIIIMDKDGKVLGSVSKDYPIYYPRQNWAEQNPEDWWQSTSEGIKEILSKMGVKGEDVKGIGLSGQMHGSVVMDKDNNVLMPAILWCDQRTAGECDYITRKLNQANLTKYTGNKALPGFTAPKILWIKNHNPGIFERITHVLLPKDYIRFKLTGEFATEVSDASGTLMFDVEKRTWSKEMLEFLELPEEALPRCFESYEITGKVNSKAAEETGLKPGTPVVGGGGDQAAGAVGTGAVKSGIMSVALGTSGVVFAGQDAYSVDEHNRLHSFCHANGKWHVMGVMLSAASCLKWWVEDVNKGLGEKGFDILLDEADKVDSGSHGLIFLPYLMGERTPYSDPDARGCFIGLNITHDRGAMTRSIIEGVSFGLRDSLEIIKDLKIPIDEVRVTGGGAKSKLWRQVLADIFGAKVNMINATEGPAYGAAILAAVGIGEYGSVEDACDELIKVTDSMEPLAENSRKYEEMYQIYKGLYLTLKDTFNKLTGI
ncbi:xylulokinase [Biomaibacter acetigenes]|uniref:Xylulose kinase n=1 Tax=Biomaibacter acetigenes TaxID=2316383 RepID=A0A3G2R387_9FIRM|nr:xylulokinase [Biomaibacter acetigenes]AYO29964.1 xylulokinase [Biomaibacter acetigenes]